ncbi:MAG: response regulator [Nitrospinae bacterium]|nr:response regulator [Nitrospinota bacterium]MBI3814400.1 response regulator [Nitrospinota bacterium]
MEKKRILVVDDEENIRILYKEELEDEGYEVITASGAEEAIVKMKESYPDLITLDVKMPGMDGIEFLRRLRETDTKIPVVMCTAYSDYKQDFRVWASNAYVVKSSDLSELRNTIRDVLKNKIK